MEKMSTFNGFEVVDEKARENFLKLQEEVQYLREIILPKPKVAIDYTGGTLVNNGTNVGVSVGAYKLNASRSSTGFERVTDVAYTTGRGGDTNGAIITNHKNGPYTVVNGTYLGINDFTISIWFNIPKAGSLSEGNSSYIIGTSKVDNTSDGFRITLRRNSADTKFEFQFRAAGSTTGLKEFSGFTYGEWHHLVVVREGTALKMYANENLVHTEILPANFDFWGKALALGAYYGDDWEYNDNDVYYDDVHIYDEALTLKQINNIYQLQ